MTTPEFRAGAALNDRDYATLVQQAVFRCCKWNLTAHDTPTICRFPILVSGAAYDRLARTAEALAAEALEAEAELISRPALHPVLGLPARRFKGSRHVATPRFLRVDFHPTPDGYRITEANSDVAGGFIEGSGLSALWAAFGAGRVAGDPARALAEAFVTRFGREARVGLMHLTRYVDDRQVVMYLARHFTEAGLRPVLFDASQLRSGLHVILDDAPVALDALFRFFPAEWLSLLPAQTAWRELFTSSAVCNPVTGMLTQSKRFPLVWPQLETRLPTWRALTPSTFDPRAVAWPDPGLVLKPAFGHEGFGVSMYGASDAATDLAVARQARRFPAKWVAQQRFDFQPIQTAEGPRYVCLGVYVVEGRAAGTYARLAHTSLINENAQDAVVLLENP